MQIRRIASRFARGTDGVTGFFRRRSGSRLRKGAWHSCFLCPLPGTLMLWVTYFMGLVIYYVLLSWMPTLMLGMGYPLAESARSPRCSPSAVPQAFFSPGG